MTNPLLPTREREVIHYRTTVTVESNEYDEVSDENVVVLVVPSDEDLMRTQLVLRVPPAQAHLFPLGDMMACDAALEVVS